MKIRSGFVSNSSSTSFCIYGTRINIGELRENLPDNHELKDLDDNVDFAYEIGLDGYSEIFEEGYGYYGRSYADCPDDMTMGDFKKKVEKEVENFVGRPVKCGYCSEAWYNG